MAELDKEPFTRLYRLKHKHQDGYSWLEDRAAPQVGTAGEVLGIVGVAHHLTEPTQGPGAPTD